MRFVIARDKEIVTRDADDSGTALEGSLQMPTILPVPTVVWAINGADMLKSVSQVANRQGKTRAIFPAAALMT